MYNTCKRRLDLTASPAYCILDVRVTCTAQKKIRRGRKGSSYCAIYCRPPFLVGITKFPFQRGGELIDSSFPDRRQMYTHTVVVSFHLVGIELFCPGFYYLISFQSKRVKCQRKNRTGGIFQISPSFLRFSVVVSNRNPFPL